MATLTKEKKAGIFAEFGGKQLTLVLSKDKLRY